MLSLSLLRRAGKPLLFLRKQQLSGRQSKWRLPPHCDRRRPTLLDTAQRQQLQQQQQRREYWFVPTSWTELQLRMRISNERKTVYVKLLKDQWKDWAAAAAAAAASATTTAAKTTTAATARAGTSQTTTTYHRDVSHIPGQVSSSSNRLVVKYRARYSAAKDRYAAAKTRYSDAVKTRYSKSRSWFRSRYTAAKARSRSWLSIQRVKFRSKRSSYRRRMKEKLESFLNRVPATAAAAAAAAEATEAALSSSSATASQTVTKPSSRVRHLLSRFFSKDYFPRTARQWSYLYYRTAAVQLPEYVESNWFCPLTSRPVTSQDATGRFVNPWLSESTAGVHSLQDIARWRVHRTRRKFLTGGWRALIPDVDVFDRPLSSLFPRLSSLSSQLTLDVNTQEQQKQQQQEREVRSKAMSSFDAPPETDDTIQLTWLGHATCLVQNQDCTVLTDPMFSRRASPYSWIVGVSRTVPAACGVTDLPRRVDLCVLSHDHYDHLDRTSCRQLADRVDAWVVPEGVGEYLRAECDIDPDRIVEMRWWESVRFEEDEERRSSSAHWQNDSDNNNTHGGSTTRRRRWRVAKRHLAVFDNNAASESESTIAASQAAGLSMPTAMNVEDSSSTTNNSSSNGTKSIVVSCCPAQHWCGRTMFDRNYRLWASFCVQFPALGGSTSSTPFSAAAAPANAHAPIPPPPPPTIARNRPSFYFGGDTAYPENGYPLFEQIRDFLGGGFPSAVDLAALPIGAYCPDYYMRDSHMNPEEAVAVHRQLRASKSVGVHWGAFELSEEPMEEPPIRLKEAVVRAEASSAANAAAANANNDNVVAGRDGSDATAAAAAEKIDFVTIPLGESVQVRSAAAAAAVSFNEEQVAATTDSTPKQDEYDNDDDENNDDDDDWSGWQQQRAVY